MKNCRVPLKSVRYSRLPAALLALCFCLAALPARAGAAEPDSPVSYDSAAGTCSVAGRLWTNLFEWSASPGGNFLIYVASQLGEEPDAWLYDREADAHRRLTDNGYFIESQARVDDGGNWALVLTETSNGRSELLYNGEPVANNKLLNRSPCLWNGKLFYAAWDAAAGTTGLFLYDPEAKKTDTLAAGLPLSTGSSAAAGDAVLLEAYDPAAGANVVLAVRPEAEEDARIKTLSGGDSFLLPSDGEARILRLSGDDNARYLFNACYWLNRYQSGEPWSGSPDSAGRVSWNQSYRLLGMLELWEKTGDKALCAKISAAVERLISTRRAALQNGGEERDGFLFVTRKYSMDYQSELRALVNNAMVYWPMLRAANGGCLSGETRQTLLSMAESAFQYYEEVWDPASGCYRSPRGAPVKSDGSVLPFNQQNAFGLCLIELWKATGNPAYRERCADLAQTFAREMELTDDGRAIWRYWPQEHYNGWTEADNVSLNTPVRAPTDNPPYEDSSHAALNAAFILEYSKTFGDIFSPAQLQGLRRTLDAVRTDEGTSRFLEPVEITNCYLNGLWAALLEAGERESAFARQFRKTDVSAALEFDSQDRLYAFARLYDPAAGGKLRAAILLFADGSLRSQGKRAVPLRDIPALAGRFRTVPAALF